MVAAVLAVTVTQAVPVYAAGGLDALRDAVSSATSQWFNRSIQFGQALFFVMMTVSFVTMISRYAIKNQTVDGLGHSFMDFFIQVIPLYVIMGLAPAVLPTIGAVGTAIGGQITGEPITGPSEIFMIGLKMVADIMTAALAPLALATIPVIGEGAMGLTYVLLGVGGLASLFIIGSFTLIAFEYLFAYAQALITLSVGAVSLGWLGGEGTRDKGHSFLNGAWLSLMRLVVTIAIVGLIVSTVPHMMDTIGTGDFKAMFMSWVQLGAASVFAALMATKIPAFAQHVFTGQAVASAPAVANDLFRAGTRVVRAAA